MFYNQGASSTSATVVRFKTVEDVKRNKSHLEIHALGSGWDRNLGRTLNLALSLIFSRCYCF